MDCENLAGCPFYNDKMPIDSGLGKLYKQRYCTGDKTKCARYKVCTALGKLRAARFVSQHVGQGRRNSKKKPKIGEKEKLDSGFCFI